MKNLTFLSRQAYWTKHSDLNPKLRKAEYAVRGLIPSTAEKIKEEMSQGKGNYPFDEIVELNIGNPQIFG